MNYTVSVNEHGETCVYTLQTSEPGIHPEMLQTDEPKGQVTDVNLIERQPLLHNLFRV